jgi:protein tyrosine phosphatase (PTP) superfamily phosphohydrolase (DUF442 family)
MDEGRYYLATSKEFTMKVTRPLIHSTIIAATLVTFSGTLISCAMRSDKPQPVAVVQPARTPIPQPTLADLSPKDYPGIHNAVAYHEGFISGSVPEGDAGFETLAAMGIKTIITVDGAEPEVEKAAARGIKYIHLPIGYNGFTEKRKLEITRATRDAMKDGPVYIHCHHGKHRSAGAAAAAAASLGWLTPEAGVARMKVSGTAPNYKGLYSCAANAGMVSSETLDAVPADFPSVAKPGSFVSAMVDIDEAMDHLKAIEKAGWKVPADHPDLVAVAEAGRAADLLRVLMEDQYSKSKPAAFGESMSENQKRFQKLEDMLAEPTQDPAKLSEQFKLVAASCKDCHTKFRD